MYAILDYILLIFKNIVHVLSIKPFPDVNISYIQLICSVFVISSLLNLCFGGLKEVEKFNDSSLKDTIKVSKGIANNHRKQQIVDDYEPRHAKK